MNEVVETDPTGRFARSSEVLGKGSSKTVYKAFDSVEGREVAWNQALLTNGSMRAAHGLLHTEVKVLKSLKHRNIMNFYASWVDDEHGTLNFITEFFHSGTLKRHRLAHKSLQLNRQLLKRWSWQILQGLVYLHGHNPPVIHRDLKCDNIFIHGVTGEVKIGDLGLARLMEENFSMCHTCIGTPEFMAPELYKEEYNEKVDIYSFGMCILELVTMTYPYSECKTACQIYRYVTEGIPPQALDKVTDDETRDFIELCIRYDHYDRPSARQLVKHKFFDDVRTPARVCKLRYTPSCPELALDEDYMHPAGASRQDSRPFLQHISAPGYPSHLPSDSVQDSMDEEKSDDSLLGLGNLFPIENSDADEGCQMAESPNGSKSDASSVGKEGEESMLETKKQFSIQHRASPVLPFVDVVNFELCFGGEGTRKRLLFSFDVVSDTVEDVGLELEEEFSLTPEETYQFNTMLKQELERALGNHPRATHEVHTFGNVTVSMSLDDWTAKNEESSSRPLHSHQSAEQSMTRISFKVNLEKSKSMHSSRTVCPESAKRIRSNDSESAKKSVGTDKSARGPRRSFCFERPTTMWHNLVHHLKDGATVCQHSVNHSLYKLGRLWCDPRALSQDESVATDTCLGSERCDRAMAAGKMTDTAGALTDAAQGPGAVRKLKTRQPGLYCTRPLSPVFNQVRSVAVAVRHLKEAAIILCRNSLEGKKIFFEIKGRGSNRGRPARENSRRIEATSRSRKRMNTTSDSCGGVDASGPKAICDSAHWSEEPDDTYGFKGCSGCLHPFIIKRGTYICLPLRRIVRRTPRPWQRKQPGG